MYLLVSGATSTLRGLPADAPVGHLVTPHTGNRLTEIAATGRPWAADNGCFGGFDEGAFRTMLQQIEALHKPAAYGLPGDGSRYTQPLWVVVPDVVGDAYATTQLFEYWKHTVRPYLSYGWHQLAYVAQDGAENARLLPRRGDHWRTLFIGGSTVWKESDGAAWLITQAKKAGKRVHIGRVNTERRLRLFDGLGIDSIDGTQFSRFPDTYIPRWAERLQPSLRGRAKPPATLPLFEDN